MAESSFVFVFLFLGIIILAIELSQWLSKRIGIPQVLGEILAGIIAGPTAFKFLSLTSGHESIFKDIGWASDTEIELTVKIFTFMAEVAALFLLLEVGLEIDFDMLKKVKKESLNVAVGGLIVPFITGFIFVYLLWNQFNVVDYTTFDTALFLGVTLTATSIGVSIRVLIELGRINADTTRIMIGAAIIDDILALGLFSVIFSYIEGEEASKQSHPLEELGILIGSIILFFAIIFVLDYLVHNVFINILLDQSDKYRSLTISLSLLFLMSALAGYLKLAPIIGAFMVGVIISRNKTLAHEVVSLTRPISKWVVPMFFIAVGLRIDLSVISSVTILVLSIALGVLAVISKIIGGGFGARIQGQNFKQSMEIGIGMSPRAEVIIIIATTAFELGVFDAILYAMVVFTVAFTAILAPFLLKRVTSTGEEKGVEA